MAQLDTSIPMSIQPGPSAMQQMTQAMNLASMMQARQDAIAARQVQAAAAQEQKRQQRLVQQGATQGQSPIDLIGMGVDPAALKEYSDLYNKHQDWLLKDRDAKDKLQKENLKALAGAAYDLDPNDPTALQIFQERAKLLGISTDGLPQNLGAIKNLAAMALTPQEKIAQQQKNTELGTQKITANTNQMNAKTQADNLQLQREKFEWEKNKPPKEEGKQLTDTGTTAFQQAAIAAQTAQKLKAKLDEVAQLKKGPITGYVLSKNPYDADLQEIENYVNMLVPSLSRGVFKEVGVLTDNDIKRYKKMVATAKTDPNVASKLMANLMNQIDDTYKIYKKTYKAAGYNTGDFENYNSIYDITEKPTNNVVPKTIKQKKALDKEFDALWGE